MSPTKRWVVYLHENRVNGKKYIGITSQAPERRWLNGRGYAGNRHFSAAIQKYGWHAFRHEILYTGLSQKEAERLEIELIAFYQTQDIDRGYNLTAGGDGVRGLAHTSESRARMSAAQVGRVRPAGTKKPPETATKSGTAPGARPVRCVETGIIYPAIAEAARATNTSSCKISLCCQGKRHTTGGYHWEYYGAPIFDTKDFCKKGGKGE